MSRWISIRRILSVVSLLAAILPSSVRSLKAQTPGDAAAQADSGARDHNERGIALARQGDQAGAAEEFRAAVKLRPDYAEAYYNLGKSLEQIGQTEPAVTAFRSAARLRPNSAVMHLGLA